MTESEKAARKRMYEVLRVDYPNADKQTVKMMAYDCTREAVEKLKAQQNG